MGAEGRRVQRNLVETNQPDFQAIALPQQARCLLCIAAEAPGEHRTVAQALVALVAIELGDRLGECVHILSGGALSAARRSDPDRNSRSRSLEAVDAVVFGRDTGVVTVQHELAEVWRAHLGEFVSLVNAPLFDGKVGERVVAEFVGRRRS